MTSEQPRWTQVDPGVQQERTALAWERTAISAIVVSTLVIRVAAANDRWPFIVLGATFLAGSAAVLLWASSHYHDLHEPIANDHDIVQPRAARYVGIGTILLTSTALVITLLDAAESLNS